MKKKYILPCAILSLTATSALARVSIPSGPSSDSEQLLSMLQTSQEMRGFTEFEDLNKRLFRVRSGESVGGLHQMNLLEADRWSIFSSVSYLEADFDGSGAEVDSLGFSLGGEYKYSDNLRIGLTLFSQDSDTDMNNGSTVEADSFGGAAYLTYGRSGWKNLGDLYVGALFGYSSGSYDTSRDTGGGLAFGHADSQNTVLSINVGLLQQKGAFDYGPYAGITWVNGSVDGFTETGAGSTTYPSVDIDGLTSEIGYQVSYQGGDKLGGLHTQFRVGWQHQFEDGDQVIDGFTVAPLEQDYLKIGLGASLQMGPNSSLLFDWEGRFSGENDIHSVGLKVKIDL